ncbi:MAG TPA: hypothetical protein IAD07_04285 [Candidatus Fimivicinus intestinavium]|nr:hypothetical protein [Candidatus Fimivicinus intestinavium]
MIVVDDVQIIPPQLIVGQQFRLRLRAHEEIQYADTSGLAAAINAANALNPADYTDFGPVSAAVSAGQALLNANPTVDRQAEVDAAAQAIHNAIAALQWAEGTINNPIPYRHLMSVTEGLYYSYNGNTYRCLRSESSSLMVPGTAPRYWERV